MLSDEEGGSFRDTVCPEDVDTVLHLVSSTAFFNREELQVAVELVEEHLAKGETASGYSFVFLEIGTETAGYACYGRVPGTRGSWDLYWIAVGKKFQRRGYGLRLLAEVERRIRLAGGRHIYIETSSTVLYHPTHVFYEHCGYEKEAVLTDFYGPGDSKIIYRKVLSTTFPTGGKLSSCCG